MRSSRKPGAAWAASAGALVAGCTVISGAGDLSSGSGDSGGVARDAPPADAAPGGDGETTRDATPRLDTGNDAAAPACPSFATFCDDFEGGDLSRWTSLLQTNGGILSITTAPARETRALRVRAPTTPLVDGGHANVGAAARLAFPAVTGGLLAVRAMVFMTERLAAETTFLKIVAKSPADAPDDMNVKIHGSGQIKVDTDTAKAGADLVGTKGAPLGRWFCLEWQATVGAAGHQKLVLDGETIVDAPENTATAAGYVRLEMGFIASPGDVTQEVAFDDVVVAPRPIGCP